MFKMRVVDWENRKQNRDLLEQYFRMRHSIYVETRKWSDIERPIPMEIDAYDNRSAIYLIGAGDGGAIMGGTRLVPTVSPHLLADVFPELANYAPPRSDDILEWTRFFVSPALQVPSSPSKAAGIVLCGILEYALAHDVRAISVVCEAFWPARLQKLGWQIEQLGPILQHKDGDIVGLRIPIFPATLKTTKEAYGLPLEQCCLEKST